MPDDKIRLERGNQSAQDSGLVPRQWQAYFNLDAAGVFQTSDHLNLIWFGLPAPCVTHLNCQVTAILFLMRVSRKRSNHWFALNWMLDKAFGNSTANVSQKTLLRGLLVKLMTWKGKEKRPVFMLFSHFCCSNKFQKILVTFCVVHGISGWNSTYGTMQGYEEGPTKLHDYQPN